jgi:hypothetical protein
LRPSSIRLIFDSEPRIALAASVADMPRDSRSCRNCAPSRMRSTVGALGPSGRASSALVAAGIQAPFSHGGGFGYRAVVVSAEGRLASLVRTGTFALSALPDRPVGNACQMVSH